MIDISRRGFVHAAAGALAVTAFSRRGGLLAAETQQEEWIRTARVVIAEAYNPPFYPKYTFNPERAVDFVKTVNGNALRYPTASYYAYFPTKTRYPIHPALKGGKDPMRKTVDLLKKAGLKAVAYVPLNHPFMEVSAKTPDFADWIKRNADGSPMIGPHFGYDNYYEGCLHSPLREEIKQLVSEVIAGYPFDVMYFDGPYQGMLHRLRVCHCKYCAAVYEKDKGKPLPKSALPEGEDRITYANWMREEVFPRFMREIVDIVHRTRKVPIVYNNASMFRPREPRKKLYSITDGFMFEASETPEQKLFNLQLGRSTGKVVWTYVGNHTASNRERTSGDIRGWYSYPVESEELLLDGAVAIAAGVGLVYWGISRHSAMPKPPLSYDGGRFTKEVFDAHQAMAPFIREARTSPQVGILVGVQSLDWYDHPKFTELAFAHCHLGAYHVLKENSFEAEPFLDFDLSPDVLRRYQAVYLPNVPCLSAAQCKAIRDYVSGGGILIATQLTSAADEVGRPLKNFQLADLFGVDLLSHEFFELPDLYLRTNPAQEMIPQDLQVARIKNRNAQVLAETWDFGNDKRLGPAVVTRSHGKGRVIYLTSGMEAAYYEMRMAPMRDYFQRLLEPLLGKDRRFFMTPRPGVMPQYAIAGNRICLHLLANTGAKIKRTHIREQFMPVSDIEVKIRIPRGRTVKSVSLVRAGGAPPHRQEDGWVHVTVPRVFVHEAVMVELA